MKLFYCGHCIAAILLEPEAPILIATIVIAALAPLLP
jgi:hypothetical protein